MTRNADWRDIEWQRATPTERQKLVEKWAVQDQEDRALAWMLLTFILAVFIIAILVSGVAL
jgi:hypothetical protein